MAFDNADLEKLAAIMATAMTNASANSEKFGRIMDHATRMGKKYNDLTQAEIKLIEAKIQADDEYAERVSEGSKKVLDGSKQLGSTLLNAVKGLGSMVNSVAASDQSFTALSPVVGMIGNVAKGVTEAMGKMLSGITILGSGTGRVSEGLAQLAGIGIDLVTSAIQQQLEASQKLVNNFTNISKTGVTFGGSLDGLQRAAAKGGMSIDTYSKFVTKNAENLSYLGGSVTDGAAKITRLGKDIGTFDKKLLAMYGSYDELAGGVSDYMATMSRYGINVTKTDKDLSAGAREYLYNMKELSDLTGKSAEALKKEEEERAKSAAYQLAMSKKSVDEQANLQRAFSLAQMEGGKDAQAYLQEYVANNGKVLSASGLKFASQFPEMSKTIRGFADTAGQTQTDYKRSSAKLMETSEARIRSEVANKEQLYKLQASGVKDAGGILDMTNSVAAAHLGNVTKLENATTTQAEMEKDRNKKIDKSTEVYANSINSLENFKKQVDAITISHLKDIGPMMDGLYKVAEKSAKALDHVDTVVNKMLEAFDKATKALNGEDVSAGDSAQDDANWARMSLGEKMQSGAARGIEKMGKGLSFIPGLGFAGNLANSAKADRIASETKYLDNQAAAGKNQAKLAGLKVKQGDVTDGGTSDEKTIVAAQLLQKAFGENFGAFTSFKDAYHKGFPGSDHNKGLAFDFTTNPAPKDAAEAAKIKQKIKDFLQQAGMPARYVGDEYFADKVAGTTGGHFHVSLPKMAHGGIVEPSTGGTNVTVGEAGRKEAIAPLVNGKLPGIDEMIEKFDEMIKVMKDHKDVSEKHMKAAL